MSFSNGKHHKCPICESPVNEEIERYIESELYRYMKDPQNYVVKPYNKSIV